TGSVLGPALVVVVLVLVACAIAAIAVVLHRRNPHGDEHGDETPGDPTTDGIGPAWNVPARPDPVADRDALLAAMSTALRSGTPVVLYDDGPPGLGATTAMIEFAHRKRREYDVVWWVAAEDLPLVKDRLAEL